MRKLFEENKLGNLKLKNRLVRAATQDSFGARDGLVVQKQIDHVHDIVKHDLGMFITGHVCVMENGRANPFQSCMYEDIFIEGQSKIAATIKKENTVAILQISHAGCSAFTKNPFSPSGIPYFFDKKHPIDKEKQEKLIVMTKDDIEEVKQAFAKAAKRAKLAGYDGVQLHFAHSYLVSQFLNPLYNEREDEYGGSKENRIRFGLEIIKEVKKEVGEDYPILIKINSNIEENDNEFEEDFLYYIKELDKAGVSAIEVSGWNFTPLGREGLEKYYLERTKKAAELVNTPIIMLGGVRNKKDAEDILNTSIKYISLARPFISEPDASLKLKNNEKLRCISCSKCFTLYLKEGRMCIFHDKPQ